MTINPRESLLRLLDQIELEADTLDFAGRRPVHPIRIAAALRAREDAARMRACLKLSDFDRDLVRFILASAIVSILGDVAAEAHAAFLIDVARGFNDQTQAIEQIAAATEIRRAITIRQSDIDPFRVSA